jgi:hypothetical protein
MSAALLLKGFISKMGDTNQPNCKGFLSEICIAAAHILKGFKSEI